jgi:hypothetical protein
MPEVGAEELVLKGDYTEGSSTGRRHGEEDIRSANEATEMEWRWVI